MGSLIVAKLTVLDLIRRRLLVVLGLFAVGMILLSFPLRVLTTGEWHRVISDVGLGATDLSLTLIAILLGATLVASDLERRTLYPLLAKPITRSAFVVGKMIGLSIVLAFLAATMGGGTALMLRLAKEQGMIPIVQATCSIAVGAILVGSLAVMFSSFTSSTLASIFGLAIALLGHLTENMAYFGARAQTAFSRALLTGFSKALPDLERLNLKTMAAHGETISWHALALLSAYGLAYSVVAVSLGGAVFTQRDLK